MKESGVEIAGVGLWRTVDCRLQLIKTLALHATVCLIATPHVVLSQARLCSIISSDGEYRQFRVESAYIPGNALTTVSISLYLIYCCGPLHEQDGFSHREVELLHFTDSYNHLEAGLLHFTVTDHLETELLHFTVAKRRLHSRWSTYYSFNLSVLDIRITVILYTCMMTTAISRWIFSTSQWPSGAYIPGGVLTTVVISLYLIYCCGPLHEQDGYNHLEAGLHFTVTERRLHS
ncbi:hypothetical protein J6590_048438 [Homalodisca vitripennis]|nr:hypothetical protein J6590_048438 [Homalodisca vitripennis]